MLSLTTTPRTAWVEDFPEMPDRATYLGREGLRKRDQHFGEIWADWVLEPVEFIDAGDDVVIAVMTMTGRALGSGAPLDAVAVFVAELRDAGAAMLPAHRAEACLRLWPRLRTAAADRDHEGKPRG